MKYSIIHHPSRQINPSIMRELDRVTIYTDLHNDGCTAMHLRALSDAANTYEPTVIIEDDAILCHGFVELAQYYYDLAIVKAKTAEAVSFYLGKGAPPHMQDVFKESIEAMERCHQDGIVLPGLYHAVCYVVSPQKCQEIVRLNPNAKMIDGLLSNKLHKVGYVYPCLADHDDSQPSVVEHEGIRPTVPRVAWRFRG